MEGAAVMKGAQVIRGAEVTGVPALPDAALAALARQGSDPAFEAIVARYRPQLIRYCRGYLPEARAEDAIQQVFIRALQALRAGAEVRELRPWLYTIARNVALTERSARGFDYEMLGDERVAPSGYEDAERREEVRETLGAVAALPERQRTALIRAAIDGLSPAAIGRELGVSAVAARQLVHRARVSVRAAVAGVLPFPAIRLLRLAKLPGRTIAGGATATPPSASLAVSAIAPKLAAIAIATAPLAMGAAVVRHVLTARAGAKPALSGDLRRVNAQASPFGAGLGRSAVAPNPQPAAPPPAAGSPSIPLGPSAGRYLSATSPSGSPSTTGSSAPAPADNGGAGAVASAASATDAGAGNAGAQAPTDPSPGAGGDASATSGGAGGDQATSDTGNDTTGSDASTTAGGDGSTDGGSQAAGSGDATGASSGTADASTAGGDTSSSGGTDGSGASSGGSGASTDGTGASTDGTGASSDGAGSADAGSGSADASGAVAGDPGATPASTTAQP